MRNLLIGLLAATAAATPALAQEAAPFTGLHIDGLIGGDRAQANDGHKDGLLYGVGAGYDRQYGSAIVGIEGEFTDSDTRTCSGAGTALDTRLCAKTGRDLYIGGRVGTLVTPKMMIYGKLGYTNARFKLTENDGVDETTLGGRNLDGVRAGVGAEYAVGSNAFVKAEYRYSNYEKGLERHQALGGFGVRF